MMQVTIKSPIPDKPQNVSIFPPSSTPSLEISAIPRVIKAAFVLSPSPIPSRIPAASAITFFSAPPSSIPIISGLVYTRKRSLINTSCTNIAVFSVFAPTTTVVGTPWETSSAWLGPESTQTSAIGSSSSRIPHNVINVFSSIPLPTFTII